MLQGKTKIELTDVKTGKKEVIEKHNFITNGAHTFMDSIGGLWANTQMYYNEMWSLLFGSALIFDSPIDGDENTIFPASENKMIGGAEYTLTNTTTDSHLGSYNAAESVIDTANKTVTMVFDFTTNQCNGNIGAVCLAPFQNAQGAAFGVSTKMEAWDKYFSKGSMCKENDCRSYMNMDSTFTGGISFAENRNGLNTTTGNAYFSGNQYTTLFDKTYCKINPIVFDLNKNYGYYFNITEKAVCKIGLNTTRVSLFQKAVNWNAEMLDTHSISFPTGVTICGDKFIGQYDATHFWVFGYDTGNKETSNIYMYVVEFDTGKITKTVTVAPLITGVTPAMVPTDYQMYYASGYMIFTAKKNIQTESGYANSYFARRVKEDNPTDISIPTGVDTSNIVCDGFASVYPKFDINGRVYMSDGVSYFSSSGSSAINPLIVWDVISNTTYYRKTFYGSYGDFATYVHYAPYSRDMENPLILINRKYSIDSNYTTETTQTFGTRSTMFLSTINNLDEVVTKTSDKTMKITYTLTEVIE